MREKEVKEPYTLFQNKIKDDVCPFLSILWEGRGGAKKEYCSTVVKIM